MDNKRFLRLAEELTLIQKWEALWDDGDEHVRKARQIRREEIIHELIAARSAAARPDVEQEKRIKQLERELGRSHLQIEILKNVLGE